MNSIRNSLKHYWFSFRDLLIPSYEGEILHSSLVILRVDAIGDYILFRNFIELIKKSEKYKTYTITLIGNELWKPIAEKLDGDFIDRFIWVNLASFHKDLSYRKKALKEIEDTRYSVLFHPTYSRDHYISEVIAKRINAKEKIASKGDLSNTTKWQKKITDKTYTEIIKPEEDLIFEFYKNKFICAAFIESEIELSKPKIYLKNETPSKYKDSNHILLFIGGSTRFKKWNVSNWVKIIEFLRSNFTNNIILAGAPSDLDDAISIKNNFLSDDRIINECAKTSLIALIDLIANSQFMISNETSAPHIAAALGVSVYVIANGSHFGRFSPYPKDISHNYSAFFPFTFNEKSDLLKLSKKYHHESNYSIDLIKADEVIDKIKIDRLS